MSFLLGDKDQFATLGEVLTFIDSCETSTAFDSDNGDFLLHSVRGGDVSPTDVGMVQHKTFKKKKRKRRNLSSSTRLQQCKKAEILYLRKRVLELEEQMHQLQAASKRPHCLLPRQNSDKFKIEVQCTWEELAEALYQARLQSEEKNRTLKTILAHQVQASKALCAVMQKQAMFQVTLRWLLTRYFSFNKTN